MSPQRILVVAEFWTGASAAGLVHGLRQLGHSVIELDWRDHLAQLGRSIPGRVAQRLLHRRSVARLNRMTLDAATQDISVFLTVKGSFIAAQTLSAMKKQGIFCANFYPDVGFDHTGMDEGALAGYDLIATTKSYHNAFLDALVGPAKHCFIAHGYSTGVHVPVDVPEQDSGYDWDVTYVGNPSDHKVDWLEAVCSAFPEKRIAVAGHRWRDAAQHNMREAATIMPAVLAHDYARLISRSRINLGFHYGPDGKHGWQDKVSTRSFEIPACKGFMLHIDNDEIRQLYSPDREIGVFADKGQLISKISHYLARPDERFEMIDAAYARCVPAYSLDTRAKQLMAAIELAQARPEAVLSETRSD